MNVAAYVEALQQDLANVAGVGDDAIAEAARRIATALESSLRLRLMDALGEAAAELTNQLPEGHVEVRVAAGEPELVYVPDPGSPAPTSLEDLSARITLRLPETLKTIVDAAAQEAGVSANTWLLQQITRRADPKRRRRPRPRRQRPHRADPPGRRPRGRGRGQGPPRHLHLHRQYRHQPRRPAAPPAHHLPARRRTRRPDEVRRPQGARRVRRSR